MTTTAFEFAWHFALCWFALSVLFAIANWALRR
jgi:hypothetical protein